MASEITNISRLHRQLQAIEDTLQQPVGPRVYRRLSRELGAVSHSLQGLAAQNARVQNLFARTISPALADLSDKVINLAGRVVARKVETEVLQIRKEASHLEEILPSATPSQLSKEVKILQRHIQTLLYYHRLSREDLFIIAEAKGTLKKAQNKLEGRAEAAVQHFDWLSSQKPQVPFVREGLDLMPGAVEELFDLAALVYAKERKMAKLRYNQLPESTKLRVSGHLKNLRAQVFEDVLETIQALMMAAHELVGTGETYPTVAEIQEFFAERSRIIQEENGEDPLPIAILGS